MRSFIEKFGSAVYSPVIFAAFTGIVYGLSSLFLMFVPAETTASAVLLVIQSGAWTFFQIMPVLFAVAIPVGMVNKHKDQVPLTALMVFATMILMINTWMSVLGVDVSNLNEVGMGYTILFGKKVYDMSILGSIISSAIVIFVHNRMYEKQLPEVLRIFGGKTFVYIVSFVVLFPVTFVVANVWPVIQGGIEGLQAFIVGSGAFGVFTYTFLERILIPTGLHHLIYQPFLLGPAVVDGGIVAQWTGNLADFAASTEPIIDLFPEGGYALNGLGKMFAPIGIALAFYKTSFPENRKKVLGILIPTTLTAVLFGITEPFEFAFLFISPVLFVIHAIYMGLMAVASYLFGATLFTGGLAITLSMSWLPMLTNHQAEVLTQFLVGLAAIPIYFFTFRFAILKFNLPTMGRENKDVEIHDDELHLNIDFSTHSSAEGLSRLLTAVGGLDNVGEITNCATRLRIRISDVDKVQNNDYFKKLGYHGIVKSKSNIQIIVGVEVARLRSEFEAFVEEQRQA